MNPDQQVPEPSVPVVTPTPSSIPGVDLLVDLPGDTDLFCGPNQDLLIFQDGSGFDLVFDFDPSDTGDIIAIEGNVNGTGLAAVDQLAVSDTESGAVVDLGGGNAIFLAGVSSSDLDATDFAILPPIDSSTFV
jgi:Ca2+-binding RTX toxin-like protein